MLNVNSYRLLSHNPTPCDWSKALAPFSDTSQTGMLQVEAFLYLIFPEAYNDLIAYNKCRERATGVDFLDLLQNDLLFLPFQLIHIDAVIPYPTAIQELLAALAVATGT